MLKDELLNEAEEKGFMKGLDYALSKIEEYKSDYITEFAASVIKGFDKIHKEIANRVVTEISNTFSWIAFVSMHNLLTKKIFSIKMIQKRQKIYTYLEIIWRLKKNQSHFMPKLPKHQKSKINIRTEASGKIV